jgi:hypothetical protein
MEQRFGGQMKLSIGSQLTWEEIQTMEEASKLLLPLADTDLENLLTDLKISGIINETTFKEIL